MTDLMSVRYWLFSKDFRLRKKTCKLSLRTVFLLLMIILVLSPLISVQGVTSEWSPTIIVKNYYWKASKSELRDLDTQERYHSDDLIGGINVPGGGNEVSLKSKPDPNFDFFNGSRLNLYLVVEGDMVYGSPNNYSDFHLLLLPIKTNDTNFFEVLFAERRLLENLTHSSYLDSSITDTTATAFLKYHNILDVQYKWDITTGILVRKEVTAPSGLQLIVVQGRGSMMPAWTSLIVLFAVITVVVWYNKHHNGKKR